MTEVKALLEDLENRLDTNNHQRLEGVLKKHEDELEKKLMRWKDDDDKVYEDINNQINELKQLLIQKKTVCS